ncbi:MAG: MgtC/SapB family protein [Candidatus Aenigmarchaeota archaeon]|nr:MgtC/SapB family protein [Candidatus Aenigmarchaeota archaeon]
MVNMFPVEMIIKLLLAVALGILVGTEREISHKPAGLRTHALVSLGACLFTMVSIYYFDADPARIAAGIVTGIGFVGAGSIIASRGHVQGITTAASLWCVAAIGLAVGVGAYVLAIVSVVLVFIILWLKRAVKDK